MLNWIMRYQPVIKLLDELGAKRVLDVGSGWYGLSWYWPHDVVQTDLHFDGPEPDPTMRAGTAKFVPATAEDLPFEDGQFDWTVSIDMMEHLPAPIRAKAVSEIARVSRRGFIIGYPVGRTAAKVDRWLAKAWTITPTQAVPEWLEEHLAQEVYPDRQTLTTALPEGWHITRELPSGNVLLGTVIVWAEAMPLGGRLTRMAERKARTRPMPAWLDRGRTYRFIWVVEPSGF
jgi:SAM-dependent methyltransferase